MRDQLNMCSRIIYILCVLFKLEIYKKTTKVFC